MLLLQVPWESFSVSVQVLEVLVSEGKKKTRFVKKQNRNRNLNNDLSCSNIFTIVQRTVLFDPECLTCQFDKKKKESQKTDNFQNYFKFLHSFISFFIL